MNQKMIRITMYFTCIVWMIVSTGCTTYQSEGTVLDSALNELHYAYAAIHPDTPNGLRAPLTNELVRKGFTVFLPAAYQKVRLITPDNPILIVVCTDEGYTSRMLGGGTSQSVTCRAYDLHNKAEMYEGFGEYMGLLSMSEDYAGATRAALKNFPKTGRSGRKTSVVELPVRDQTGQLHADGEEVDIERQGTAWLVGPQLLVV